MKHIIFDKGDVLIYENEQVIVVIDRNNILRGNDYTVPVFDDVDIRDYIR